MKLLLQNVKVGQKIYFRQGRYFAIFHRQKQSQNKPAIMLSTFDVPSQTSQYLPYFGYI